jgi:alkylated DNA repair dioxygenase AlkB
MDTLFDIEEHENPPGFQYFPDFISADEETDLIREIGSIELHTFVFQGFEARRKVASFGYDYSFDKRAIKKGQAIPSSFIPVIKKVSEHTGIGEEKFAELLITEYPAGSVINWHRDAPPFDIIAGISLLSDCTFKFRPHEKIKQTRGSIISSILNRRSLYIIRDEARTSWQHSTAPVKSKRYSITLRTLRHPAEKG